VNFLRMPQGPAMGRGAAPAMRPMTPQMPRQPMARPPAPAPAPRPPNMGGLARGAGMALSDERSKARIRELEGELANVYRAMGGGPATGNVTPSPPPAEALDQAYRRPSANSYEYKDPNVPGAGRGRFSGPMAHELEGIPGVVKETPQGKMVDTPRLTMANTSEVAQQRREIDALKRTVLAMGGKKKGKKIDVEIGPAEIEKPPKVEIGPAEDIRPAPKQSTGPTQQAQFTDDPKTLEYLSDRYGTPVLGGSSAGALTEEESSLLDDLFGPNIGQEAEDIANETRANEELRQQFRRRPRQDVFL
jgi:hypothetical protein